MADYKEVIEKLEKDGYAVIPGFLTEEEVDEVLAETKRIIDEIDVNQKPDEVYNSSNNSITGKYFLDSVDKAGHFYEKDAFNEKGELVLPKERSLHKLGHGLHIESPVFAKMTFSEKTKAVLKALGYKKPAVIQGMLNFKNPSGVGSEFVAHQDATYLTTEPKIKVVGLWIPLADSTLENGCLWFIPGSHNYPLGTRFVRAGPEKYPKCEFTNEKPVYDDQLFVPAPVKKGDLVILDGLTVHKSERNKSDKPRPAYTMHFYDSAEVTWAPDNTFLMPEGKSFPVLYESQAA